VIKSELILRLAGRNPYLHQRDVEKVVNAILDEIVTALAGGDRVELRGFGSFSAKIRGGRIGRNPKTGATVQVPEKKIPYFRQGQKF
jgi:integration host factor subunit beta